MSHTLISPFFKIYRWFFVPIFVGLGASCRFQPSCSQYAELAIARFGWYRGLKLSLRRVGRCHPGCAGGVDEVPEA